MTNEQKGGAIGRGPIVASPNQGGSHMGGSGATGAVDRYRQEKPEGFTEREGLRSSAREAAIIKQAQKEEAQKQAAEEKKSKGKDAAELDKEQAD